jgi:hypothetical protein
MPRKHNTPERHPTGSSPIDKAKAHEVVWRRVAPLFEAARYWGGVSFVYFIGEPDDGLIKIGYSKDPIGRLRSMQTGNPRRLRMERVLVGAMATEKMLQQFWEPHAIVSATNKGVRGIAPGTEWFKPEVREKLLPIIDDATRRQIDLLGQDECGFDDMERAVREAHDDHGFMPHYVEPSRRLAEGAGYVVSRRIRI